MLLGFWGGGLRSKVERNETCWKAGYMYGVWSSLSGTARRGRKPSWAILLCEEVGGFVVDSPSSGVLGDDGNAWHDVCQHTVLQLGRRSSLLTCSFARGSLRKGKDIQIALFQEMALRHPR